MRVVGWAIAHSVFGKPRLENLIVIILGFPKGHFDSKCLFSILKIFQKTNENKSTWGIIVVKLKFFVRFLEELRIPKSPFEINWPLVVWPGSLVSFLITNKKSLNPHINEQIDQISFGFWSPTDVMKQAIK